jgi:hypothetical protein
MRTSHLLVSLLGAGLVAGGVVAVTAGGQGSGPPTGTLNLTITTNDKAGRFVDLPPRSHKATSPGDEYFAGGTVTGDAKGTVVFGVTFLNTKTPVLQGVVSLTNGKIFVEEVTSEATKTVRGAIVGGTGAYAGARGDYQDKTIKTTKTSTITQITATFIG